MNDGVTQAVQGIRAIIPILQDSAHFEKIRFIYVTTKYDNLVAKRDVAPLMKFAR
jgi:hypothetical protein